MNPHFVLSVSFFGSYRPVHFTAATPQACAKLLRRKCTCPEIRAAAGKVARSYTAQRKRGLPVHSLGSQSASLSIHLQPGPRNPWLDDICASYPAHPAITY